MIRDDGDRVLLAVRGTPGASRDAVVGVRGDELRVTVTAPPLDGRANAAVCALIATTIGVRVRNVCVEHGLRGRSKVVAVRGLTIDEACRRLGPEIGQNRAAGR